MLKIHVSVQTNTADAQVLKLLLLLMHQHLEGRDDNDDAVSPEHQGYEVYKRLSPTASSDENTVFASTDILDYLQLQVLWGKSECLPALLYGVVWDGQQPAIHVDVGVLGEMGYESERGEDRKKKTTERQNVFDRQRKKQGEERKNWTVWRAR